jgi:tRNA threonylcarbamoyladenosine biosynthesis protein TsaE
MQRIVTHSEQETIDAGAALAAKLLPGAVVALYGDLGSGKTRFAKGISLGLGITETVTSPTFTIVNEHRGGRLPLFHFDCYRLRSSSELDELGFDEYIFGEGVCVLEWAEMIAERLPEQRFDIRITAGALEHERNITVEQR